MSAASAPDEGLPKTIVYEPPDEVRPALGLMLRSGLYGANGREVIRNLVHERIRALALTGELARIEEMTRSRDDRPPPLFR